MTKFYIYFSLFLILATLTIRIGGAVYAADSGVSLGVNVLSAGPATINDFNYQNLNQPVSDSGEVKGANSDASNSSIESTPDSNQVNSNNISNESVSGTNINNTGTLKDASGKNQGSVKGAESNQKNAWYIRFMNWCANLFKKII